LLTRLVQSAVAAEEEAATLAAEEAQRKKEEDEAAADKKNKKNKEVQEADAVEEEEEEIEIKVIDGTKRERTMLTMKRPLKNMSPVLRQQIVNLPPAKFVDAPQTLVFDARGMLYDRVINWDVIQMPVIEKMCKMLQNPDCVEKKYSLLEKIQTLDEVCRIAPTVDDSMHSCVILSTQHTNYSDSSNFEFGASYIFLLATRNYFVGLLSGFSRPSPPPTISFSTSLLHHLIVFCLWHVSAPGHRRAKEERPR
jgi:hypothetical protein